MRHKKQWQPAEPGVMVYMPSGHVAIEDTQQSLAQLSVHDVESFGVQALPSLSEINDTILPSLEGVDADIQVKTEQMEPCGFTSSSTDSPDTLAHDKLDQVFHEVISTPSSAGTDLVAQLMAAAERNDEAFDATASKSALVDTPAMMGGLVDVGYESDRTDFQESTSSPSERKRNHRRRSAMGKTSRHFRQNSGLMKRKPLARRLDFGAKKAAKNVKRSLNAQALEDLRSLERSPSHKWTDDERELLCVINRWYTGPDRPAELTVFSEIFNAITGLRLRPRVIRSQFESHLRLYGANAYPMLGRVFAVPFHDPEGRYVQIRALIEEEARTLRLDLRRRMSELTVASGKAQYAKSPVTRSIYENKVERVSQKIREGGKLSAVLSVPRPAFKMSMPVRVSEDDDWEVVVDAELSLEDDWELVNDVDSSAGSASRTTSQRPHLAFRVWDAASRTEFIDGSFVAQTFVDWPRPFPAPIALEDPSGAGKILALLHLSKKGDTPVYISTASSLLQALSYATTMEQPCIATIDLNAASLQQEHKLHHAAEVFPWLKRQGLARWARYRGHGEYFIWSDIPAEAVLSTKNLNHLICSLNADEDCRQLLGFHTFEPGIKTNVLAAALRERNVVMSSTTSRALGKTARMFGLGQGNATLHHVRNFVARVIDGWTVAKADVVDVQTMSFLAATFASALGAHEGGYTVQNIMGAFVEGVEEGTRCIAHWSKSRSGGRRGRFRKR